MITWKEFVELLTKRKRKRLLDDLRGRNIVGVGIIEEVIRWLM